MSLWIRILRSIKWRWSFSENTKLHRLWKTHKHNQKTATVALESSYRTHRHTLQQKVDYSRLSHIHFSSQWTLVYWSELALAVLQLLLCVFWWEAAGNQISAGQRSVAWSPADLQLWPQNSSTASSLQFLPASLKQMVQNWNFSEYMLVFEKHRFWQVKLMSLPMEINVVLFQY